MKPVFEATIMARLAALEMLLMDKLNIHQEEYAEKFLTWFEVYLPKGIEAPKTMNEAREMLEREENE